MFCHGATPFFEFGSSREVEEGSSEIVKMSVHTTESIHRAFASKIRMLYGWGLLATLGITMSGICFRRCVRITRE